MGDAGPTLRKLLRGEMAAVDAYRDALERLDDGTREALLHDILRDHERAAERLREHVRSAGGDPDEGPGPWGAFARAVERAASWIGDPTALRALREGEVHGLSEYRTALSHEELPADTRRMIETELLPAQEEHVDALERLTAEADAPGESRTLEDRVGERRG